MRMENKTCSRLAPTWRIQRTMGQFRLEYPITRPFTFRYFTKAVLVLQVIWLIFITFINIVAVGYETVSITSTTFNSTTRLWYEKFVPTFWLSQSSRSCDGSVIPLNGGSLFIATFTKRQVLPQVIMYTNTLLGGITTAGTTHPSMGCCMRIMLSLIVLYS
jgi:hypothetical protein